MTTTLCVLALLKWHYFPCICVLLYLLHYRVCISLHYTKSPTQIWTEIRLKTATVCNLKQIVGCKQMSIWFWTWSDMFISIWYVISFSLSYSSSVRQRLASKIFWLTTHNINSISSFVQNKCRKLIELKNRRKRVFQINIYIDRWYSTKMCFPKMRRVVNVFKRFN